MFSYYQTISLTHQENLDKKELIAAKCLEFIESGDTIILDSGSTTTTKVTVNATSAEWKDYKAAVDVRIARNNDRIHDLKIMIKKPGVVLDAMREKRIDELKERNAKLRSMIADYKNDHTDWVVFKTDIDKQLDEVSKSLDEMQKDAKK